MNGQLALKTSYDLQDFIAVHYGQSSFNGHVVIGASKKELTSIYRFRSITTFDLQKEVCSLNFKNMNYYITANSFSGLDRKQETLFALENVVIDIDHHSGDVSAILHHNRIEKLLRCIKKQMPEYLPNSVVRTGRGLQLWYSLKAAHKSLSRFYLELVDILICKINSIILKDKELYDYFGCVDAAPCRNMAGYFRMPGTYNTKTGCRGSFEIWHREKIDLTSISIPKKEERPAKIIALPKSMDGYILSKKRLYQMEELRKIRLQKGQPEQRDLMNLVVYCSCAAAYDEKELHKIVNRFNSGHKNPLPEKELWQQLSTAEKKKYKLSNKWIIENLSITREEQEQIGLREKGSISNRELDRQKARERKKERNEKINFLALEGYTYKEISKIVNCSEKTVSRVVTAAGVKKTWSDLHTQISELLESGYSKEEAAELLGVCIRTVERHMSVEEAVQNSNSENSEQSNMEKKEQPSKNSQNSNAKKACESDIILIKQKNTKENQENDKKDKNAPIYVFSIERSLGTRTRTTDADTSITSVEGDRKLENQIRKSNRK